ncbi:hypothetical protein P3X46_011287 [Hevea brasiliensis]|uniref:Gag-Pol polyprotein/retrotransposon n=1 Tax=Hevea brasiliensis TaxID=3981 RepID=A0ABQ9MIR3_HEVBR|nr:uncharacterized protein LOC110634639 [Hevea brasiliensis]KAJ9179505.1 hypothetical protein P3X46_011287 [Hevea brasiliensis]
MSSFSLKITGCCILSLHHLGFNDLPCNFISGVSRHYNLQKLENSSLHWSHTRRLCSVNGESNAYGSSNPDISTSNVEGSREKTNNGQESLTSSEILKKLKRYGISGILSYGLLNTAYYLTTFLLVWFYVAPSPAKMGYFAAVERFLKVMAMVWAGSQVTKLVRAGGALALAPFVDRGLSWFTVKFKFGSEGKAFMALVGVCFGLAFILFLVVTLLWA